MDTEECEGGLDVEWKNDLFLMCLDGFFFPQLLVSDS